jgi:AcrR family transcriptional regulator
MTASADMLGRSMDESPRYRDAARQQLRDAIVDAARELTISSGWDAVRMGHVAARVGVSRQTVYNEFGDKLGLAHALMLRDHEHYLDGVDEALSCHDDLHSAVAAAVAYSLETAADDPFKKAVLTGAGSEDLLPLFTTQAEPMLFSARTRIIEHAIRHWPELDREAVTELADAAVRLTLSHVLLPAEPPEKVAELIARIVTRYLR